MSSFAFPSVPHPALPAGGLAGVTGLSFHSPVLPWTVSAADEKRFRRILRIISKWSASGSSLGWILAWPRRRMNSAGGGSVDLSAIPLYNVDRVEIYKGNIPSEFGGSGSGGVIHIITNKAKQKFNLNSHCLSVQFQMVILPS